MYDYQYAALVLNGIYHVLLADVFPAWMLVVIGWCLLMLGHVSQEVVDFQSATLPALLPILSTATGDPLLLLVKHASLLINKVCFSLSKIICRLHC